MTTNHRIDVREDRARRAVLPRLAAARTSAFALLAFLTILAASRALAQEPYRVIAHSSVPVATLSRSDLSLLFLRKTTTWGRWGSGDKVVPFDLKADSETRESFSKAVHKKAAGAVKSYWQQQIFSGRGTPPAEMSGDGAMIAAVARTPGAIGYVSAGATLPETVKEIKVSD